MKPEDIIWIRENFKIPNTIDDAHILEAATALETGSHHLPLNAKVGNMLTRMLILEEVQGEQWGATAIFENQAEITLQRTVEDLFVDGYYGACCVMSRSCVEYMLQNDCLDRLNSEESDLAKKVLDGLARKDRNPFIKDMITALGSRISDGEVKLIWVVVDNGDWVVHHRYDRLTGGRGAEKYEVKFPKVRIDLQNERVHIKTNDDRTTMETFRPLEERRLAIESLKALYRLMFSMRAKDEKAFKRTLLRYADDLMDKDMSQLKGEELK